MTGTRRSRDRPAAAPTDAGAARTTPAPPASRRSRTSRGTRPGDGTGRRRARAMTTTHRTVRTTARLVGRYSAFARLVKPSVRRSANQRRTAWSNDWIPSVVRRAMSSAIPIRKTTPNTTAQRSQPASFGRGGGAPDGLRWISASVVRGCSGVGLPSVGTLIVGSVVQSERSTFARRVPFCREP